MHARIFAEQCRKWWTLAAVAFGLFHAAVDVAAATVRKVTHPEPHGIPEVA